MTGGRAPRDEREGGAGQSTAGLRVMTRRFARKARKSDVESVHPDTYNGN
jgi:hypothetical protein